MIMVLSRYPPNGGYFCAGCGGLPGHGGLPRWLWGPTRSRGPTALAVGAYPVTGAYGGGCGGLPGHGGLPRWLWGPTRSRGPTALAVGAYPVTIAPCIYTRLAIVYTYVYTRLYPYPVHPPGTPTGRRHLARPLPGRGDRPRGGRGKIVKKFPYNMSPTIKIFSKSIFSGNF
jgi:hypothetical protein